MFKLRKIQSGTRNSIRKGKGREETSRKGGKENEEKEGVQIEKRLKKRQRLSFVLYPVCVLRWEEINVLQAVARLVCLLVLRFSCPVAVSAIYLQ